MSLRLILNKEIERRGYLSSEDMTGICLREGYKASNGERRLRKSESPNVETIMKKSKRGTEYIAGYTWRGTEKPAILNTTIPLSRLFPLSRKY